MANTKSAAKRALQNEKRRLRNRRYVSGARTAIKRARAAITGNRDGEGAEAALSRAFSMLDRAASKGVIHRKNAARRKSRLMLALNRARQAAE